MDPRKACCKYNYFLDSQIVLNFDMVRSNENMILVFTFNKHMIYVVNKQTFLSFFYTRNKI